MPLITSSELNKRIEIQEPIDTPGPRRGFTRVWTTLPGCKSVPANMKYANAPRKGGETWVASQVYPTVFVTFKIRYRPSTNISDIHRVVYGKRIFEIRSVSVPEEKQSSILLQCEELQAKGSLH